MLLAVDESEGSVRVARATRRMFGDDPTYLVVNVGQPELPFWGGDSLMWGTVYPLVVPLVPDEDEPPFVTAPLAARSTTEQAGVADIALLTAQEAGDAADLATATAIGASGDPATRIREIADRENVDVIVIGGHERGWMSRLLAPSVSKELLQDSHHRPVLVVP